MLDRDQIADWNCPATYAVTDAGMVVQRGPEVLLTIPVAGFPDMILRLATVLRAAAPG